MKAPVWVLTFVLAAAATPAAFAHARISPPVSLAKEGQMYTLAVPTEKEGATTTKVMLTVPSGFSIDSFVPSPGWKRLTESTGSGEDTVIQSVTWTGGSIPTDEDAFFEFLGEPSSSKTYVFSVQQTYSDGEVVNWNGDESSDTPAPTIETKSSLGGGSSTLALIALIAGGIGIVLGGIALVSKSGRQLV